MNLTDLFPNGFPNPFGKPTISILGENVTITKKCTVTGNVFTITVPTDKYLLYKGGQLLYKGDQHIQRVFPELSAEKREFIHTGITPAEWNTLIPEE